MEPVSTLLTYENTQPLHPPVLSPLQPWHCVLTLPDNNRLVVFFVWKLDQNISEFSLGKLLRRVHVCHGAAPEFVQTRDKRQ